MEVIPMVGGDYRFDIFPNTTQPFGPVAKENLDITRLIFDYTCWLNDGEHISSVSQPVVALEGKIPVPPWQNDYPLDNTSVTEPPEEDEYPLTIQSSAITTTATHVEVRISAGTPGLNYVVTVIATSSISNRRKQVDCLVTIERPLNENMMAEATPDTDENVIIVGDDATLPMDFTGRVYIENGSGHPITITLPITPKQLQRVAPVDISGNANVYPITFAGAPGDLIYSSPTFTTAVYADDLIFEWVGTHWIILASRYSFLA
jgi:hypothetical protein